MSFGLRRLFGTSIVRPFGSTRAVLRKFAAQEIPEDAVDDFEALSTEATTLPYAYRRDGETFGQLVRDYNHDLDPSDSSGPTVYGFDDQTEQVSPYRDPVTGQVRDGLTAKDARLHPLTREARVNRQQIELPAEMGKAINNHILLLRQPKVLRAKAAEYYVELRERNLHFAAETEADADAHIAAVFLQNYGSLYQVLHELRKRVGEDKFNPRRVLDVGYGPATGIVALNEIMGDSFEPEVKDAVVVGPYEMLRRAKLILSRQLAEYNGLEISKQELESKVESEDEDMEFVGEVMTKKIKIKTKLLQDIRSNEDRKYDLIMVTHQLLERQKFFPGQVDERVHEFFKRLAPGGHLVIVERGNPLGFEIIARARQVAIRPEDSISNKKIPAPYKKGAIGPDYHLRVVAPCSHHAVCPLQVSKPEYYSYGGVGKKLSFCHFQTEVVRPKFTSELKKGLQLATPWATPMDGIGIKGEASAGKGNPNARTYESANYSYLILERSANDEESLRRIEDQIEKEGQQNYPVGYSGDTPDEWPRVMRAPMCKKGLAIAEVCAPSGNLEKWHISRSSGKQDYHDARKLKGGDLYPLGAKSKILSNKNSDNYSEQLQRKEKSYKKVVKKAKKDVAHERKVQLYEAQKIIDEEKRAEHMAKVLDQEFMSQPSMKKRDPKVYKY
ncbi:unnamed protein product [Kuraishia capsulata CBS 1993]|uniref:Uncharacterized protein n=1 Tax=Kuraishia capsulata CBS 1993 TaxID=1382522 RepID=W6MM50_9ASCO|nr:uncharacterized protein KUCA_T00001948001 [Kuraishia capsulata CBS 1993]CDK25977.1 unnamed protein product [Kuraishia capsulata CBS 1993]